MPKAIHTKRTCPSCHQGDVMISGTKQAPQVTYEHNELILSFFYEEWCTFCSWNHDGFAERRFALEGDSK